MRSTFHGLEVSKRGIFAQQSALHTTGHNIANANTKGYTRQVVNMQSSLALPNPGMQMSRNPGLLGTGVDVTHVQRLRDEYLDMQYRNEAKHEGYWEAKYETLSKVEMILNEPSNTGLQATMDRYWTSWQDLAKEPEASATRAVVAERAQALIETLSAMRDGLTTHQKDLNSVVNTKANQINSLTTQIRDINDQIARIEPHGFQANDLKDQRDNLIDELAKLIDVDSVQPVFFADGRTTGMVRIMSGDIAIVDGRDRVPMEFEVNEDTGLYDISLGGELVNFTRGELMGLIESRGYPVSVENAEGEQEIHTAGILAGVIKHLDTLAVELAKQMNQIHSQGLTLDDINKGRTLEHEDADKLLFFIDKDHYKATGEFIDPRNASSLMIHPHITGSLDKIAAGQQISLDNDEFGTSYEGDGRNASDIASLKFRIMSDLPEQVTLDDFYRNLIAKVGVQVTEADRLKHNSQVLADQVENRRLSLSGVSLDEEMANMIKFQHAYNASARAITTVDGLLDTIINRMGLVGR